MHNTLQLNADKSEVIILGTMHQLWLAASTSMIHVMDANRPTESKLKLLGIKINPHMHLDNHVREVARMCSFHICSYAPFNICALCQLMMWPRQQHAVLSRQSSYLVDDCQLIADCGRPQLCSAHTNVLTVPRTNTRLGDRSFSVAGPRIWKQSARLTAAA